MPDKITIPDTSCLIILAKVELLSALYQIYKDVRITEIIKNEYIEELPKSYIERLKKYNFRISDNIEQELLRMNSE
jgi:predicted nucleic acid-binding protein